MWLAPSVHVHDAYALGAMPVPHGNTTRSIPSAPLLCCPAAVCLDPSNPKAHYRRLQALRAAGMLQVHKSATCCAVVLGCADRVLAVFC